MIEIKNKNKFPVQIVVRSKKKPNSFTTLNIPGRGAGKNIYYLQDELTTEYVDRVEKDFGLIETRHIPDREFKGE
jgi:hypothetical protein